MKSPDWKKGDLDLIKEMLREGEARLSAQVQLATSADQRATVLAGIYVAAATGIIAAITTNESITVNLALLIGASVTALLFLGGRYFAFGLQSQSDFGCQEMILVSGLRISRIRSMFAVLWASNQGITMR